MPRENRRRHGAGETTAENQSKREDRKEAEKEIVHTKLTFAHVLRVSRDRASGARRTTSKRAFYLENAKIHDLPEGGIAVAVHAAENLRVLGP